MVFSLSALMPRFKITGDAIEALNSRIIYWDVSEKIR